MKSLLGLSGCVFILALGVSWSGPASAQDGDKDKKKGDEKDIKKEVIGVLPVRPLLGTVELKDGTSLTCEFLKPADVAIQVAEIGVVTVPLLKVRLVDFEGTRQRVGLHTGDTLHGEIKTGTFPVQLSILTQPMELKSELIRRIRFPEPTSLFLPGQ